MTHRPTLSVATAAAVLTCATPALAQHADDPATWRSLNAADLGALQGPLAADTGILPDPAQCVSAMDCAQPGDSAVFTNASFFDAAEIMEFAETGTITQICTTFVFAGGSCPANPASPIFNETWTWDFFPVNSQGVPTSASLGHFDTEPPTSNMTVENFFTGTIGAGFPVFNFTYTLGGGGQVIEAGKCFAMQPKFNLGGCSAFWESSANDDGSLTGDGLSLQDSLMDGYDTCDYTANDLALCLDVFTTQPPTCTMDADIGAPVNDNCEGASAFPLVCDATTIQCLLFATQNTADDPGLPCVLSEPDDFTGDVTVFYTFTPTSNRALLSMCRVSDGHGVGGGNAPFPNGDFVLAVYEEAQSPGEGEGPCDLVQIACSDDNCNANKPYLCLNDLDPMTTYVVQVAGKDDFDGIQIEIDVTCDPMDIPPVPLNDNCTGAEELVFDGPPDPNNARLALSTQTSTVCATMDPIAGGCGTTTNGNSPGVWYTSIGDGFEWELSTYQFGGTDGDFDTQINVYCGDCSTGLVCLAGNDDGNPGPPQSTLRFCTEEGRRYYIFVHGFFDVGTLRLSVVSNHDFTGFCQNDPAHGVSCELGNFDCLSFHGGNPDIIEETDPAALMELCGTDVNSGCLIDPVSGTAFIQAGVLPFTACGSAFAMNGERDIDDYRFTVADRSLVTISAFAQFNLELFLYDSDDCDDQIVVLNSSAVASTTLRSNAILNPGTYVLRLTADQFNGVTCGVIDDYALRVDADPLGRCCILNEFTGTECCVTTEAVCDTLGTSTLFFAGGDCSPVTYDRSQTLTIAPFQSIIGETHAIAIDGGDGDGHFGDDDAQTVVIAGPDSQLTDFMGNPGEFPFEFFNECVRSVTVHSNGYVSFDRAGLEPVNDSTPEPIPTPGPEGTLNSFIAPLWTDLDPSATGDVALLLDGATPFRRLIIEWHDVPIFNQPATVNTFQLVLFEGSDCVRFLYNDIELPVITDPLEPEYAAGLENQDGTQGAALTEAEIEALDTSMLTEKEARIIEICPEHELAFPCDEIPVCRGDCDDDGMVNFNDLVAMLFQFGNPNPSFGCDADDDNDVDFNDLVAALFLFGPCP